MYNDREFKGIIYKMPVEFLELKIDQFEKLFQLSYGLELNSFRLKIIFQKRSND